MCRSMRSRSGPDRRDLIVGGAAQVLPALAGEARIVSAPATAGVHRRNELEACGIGDAVIGARDHHFAAFHRLAQRIEHLRLEFRKFVEEEHAAMRKRDFA